MITLREKLERKPEMGLKLVNKIMEQNSFKKTKLVSFRKFRSVVAVVVCGVILASCGGGNSKSEVINQTPKEFMIELYGYYEKGEVDKFLDKLFDNIDSETKELLEQEEKESKRDTKAAIKENLKKEMENPKRIEIGDEEIDGDNATVVITFTDSKGKTKTQKNKFVKENGVWKVKM